MNRDKAAYKFFLCFPPGQQPGGDVNRLLEKVWDYDYMGETNVVDVYVRYLRNKIAAAGGENVIQTVRGVGYRFVEAPA